jgi:hypothetical protein
VNDSAHSPEAVASAYGAQMAKYFTLNQPPHVAIDSAVSVVRPQLAITRLIARSGIPERTASIPAEKAYVVSVHLNHANSGEWELWTDEKYTKTGAWPVGGGVSRALCKGSSQFSGSCRPCGIAPAGVDDLELAHSVFPELQRRPFF